MENNELNNKIIGNVRNKIVISNLEKEKNMKISKRKQIVSIFSAVVLLVSGSFVTVNAATDGKLAENVKNFITITINGNKYDAVEHSKGVDENGNEYLEYKLKPTDNDEEIVIQIENNIDNENMDINYNVNEADDFDKISIENKL